MSSVATSVDGSVETTLTRRKRKGNKMETPTSQLLHEDHFNVSQEFLRRHREQMDLWLGSEWNRLIRRQESAVDAVKLEWLMKGSLCAADVEAAKTNARASFEMSPEDEKRLRNLLSRNFTISHVE